MNPAESRPPGIGNRADCDRDPRCAEPPPGAGLNTPILSVSGDARYDADRSPRAAWARRRASESLAHRSLADDEAMKLEPSIAICVSADENRSVVGETDVRMARGSLRHGDDRERQVRARSTTRRRR